MSNQNDLIAPYVINSQEAVLTREVITLVTIPTLNEKSAPRELRVTDSYYENRLLSTKIEEQDAKKNWKEITLPAAELIHLSKHIASYTAKKPVTLEDLNNVYGNPPQSDMSKEGVSLCDNRPNNLDRPYKPGELPPGFVPAWGRGPY